MSGVCHDCPGSVGCCYTYHGIDDDEMDEDDRNWQERIGDWFFLPICWTVVGCIAIGVAGLSFAAGVWGFITGLHLLR